MCILIHGVGVNPNQSKCTHVCRA